MGVNQSRTTCDESHARVIVTGIEAKIRDRRIDTYVMLFSASLFVMPLVSPVITSKLVDQFNLSAAGVGTLMFMELGAFSLATIPSYIWLRRVNLTGATLVFGVLAVVGNVMSSLADSYGELAAYRILTSVALGSVSVIVFTAARTTRSPSRSYALFLVSQLSVAALVLAIYPWVFANRPVAVFYLFLAGLIVLCLPASGFLDANAYRSKPQGRSGADPSRISEDTGHSLQHEDRATRDGLWNGLAFVGLTAVLLFYISLAGVWSFMGEMALESGLTTGMISAGLSLANVAGVIAALCAAAIGDRRISRLLVLVFYIGVMASMAVFIDTVTAATFVLSTVLFKFTYTFIFPYIVANVANADRIGYYTGTVNLVIIGGFAIGPLIAGLLISWTGQYLWMIVVCVGVMALSMGLTYFVQMRIRTTGVSDSKSE